MRVALARLERPSDVTTLNETLGEVDAAPGHSLQRSVLREQTLTTTTQAFFTTDARSGGTRIVSVSSSFPVVTGYSLDEIIGLDCRTLLGPESDLRVVNELYRALGDERDSSAEVVVYRKDRTPFWCSVNVSLERDADGNVDTFVWVLSDITLRIRLECRLFEAQQFEAIGVLAAGIAHDFKNSLMVIEGYNSLLAKKVTGAELVDLTERVDAATLQAADVARQLLRHLHSRGNIVDATDVNSLLVEANALWGRFLGADIESRLELAREPLEVGIDHDQLQRCVVNFLTNARDAMPNGGTITLASRVLLVSAGSPFPPLAVGDYALITVSDTGCGIEPATLQRIFEPFFTSKHGGTGLGLPITRKIIRDAGGFVRVTSTLGEGTVFDLIVPIASSSSRPVASQSLFASERREASFPLLSCDDLRLAPVTTPPTHVAVPTVPPTSDAA